jgi:hypothetical protein
VSTTYVELSTIVLLVLKGNFDSELASCLLFLWGNPLLAEDCRLLAFAGSPQAPEWLTGEHSELLLEAKPGGNIQLEQSRGFITRVLDHIDLLRPHLGQEAQRRGDELLDAHRRVRAAVRMRGVQYSIEPQLPPDVLGVYVYLPLN